MAKRLGDTPITLKRKVGEQDKLYGSVTSLDIVEALAARGLQLDRRLIDLPEPLKTVGDFEVAVKLHREVVGKAKVESRPRPPRRRPLPQPWVNLTAPSPVALPGAGFQAGPRRHPFQRPAAPPGRDIEAPGRTPGGLPRDNP